MRNYSDRKDSEVKWYPLCLGNISNNFTINYMKKTGLKGNTQVVKETLCNIMFGFIKNLFIGLLSTCTIVNFDQSLDCNYKESIKCVSLNNQPCQARRTLVGINYNKTILRQQGQNLLFLF